MRTSRLEAFSDGVLAIITIMVLGLAGAGPPGLAPARGLLRGASGER